MKIEDQDFLTPQDGFRHERFASLHAGTVAAGAHGRGVLAELDEIAPRPFGLYPGLQDWHRIAASS
ncbi:hypothetical protein AB0893_26275 [Micromonospora aurantiaca]|uniref:hypothetical protein n=1 Tax=Micromonospora aurantiaca (nom. illeg.) TaxID=47850 RepID=UPI003453DAEB